MVLHLIPSAHLFLSLPVSYTSVSRASAEFTDSPCVIFRPQCIVGLLCALRGRVGVCLPMQGSAGLAAIHEGHGYSAHQPSVLCDQQDINHCPVVT